MAEYIVSFRIGGKGLKEATVRKGMVALKLNREITIKKIKLMSRADRLSEAIEHFENAKGIVEDLQSEMQEWYDNIPEGLQGSDKGSRIEECADSLQTILDDMQNIDMDSIEFPGMYD